MIRCVNRIFLHIFLSVLGTRNNAKRAGKNHERCRTAFARSRRAAKVQPHMLKAKSVEQTLIANQAAEPTRPTLNTCVARHRASAQPRRAKRERLVAS